MLKERIDQARRNIEVLSDVDTDNAPAGYVTDVLQPLYVSLSAMERGYKEIKEEIWDLHRTVSLIKT